MMFDDGKACYLNSLAINPQHVKSMQHLVGGLANSAIHILPAGITRSNILKVIEVYIKSS